MIIFKQSSLRKSSPGRDGAQFSERKNHRLWTEILSALDGHIIGLGRKYYRPGRGRDGAQFSEGKYYRPWTETFPALDDNTIGLEICPALDDNIIGLV